MKPTFKQLLSTIFIVIISFAIGLGWALYDISTVGTNTSFMNYNGPWRVNPNMDLQNIKQRALIAKVGLFALRETEVLYYTATMDSEGQPLSSDFTYILEGSVPQARYWSFTIYGHDDFLIPNENKIYGFNQETIGYDEADVTNPELEYTAQETYTITISNTRQEPNWLPSGNNDQLAITLRLYNPSPLVYQNLETIPLPNIKKVH